MDKVFRAPRRNQNGSRSVPVGRDAQRVLHYRFRKPALLEEALTHRSHLQETSSGHAGDNERLEFLGDAVLGLLVSEYLANTFPEASEGVLSQIRARLVGRASLADAARQLGLGPLLRVGRGEERTEGRDKNSLLANALEAVIAAIYLDGGVDAARTFVLKTLEPRLRDVRRENLAAFRRDYKSQLQEWAQQRMHALPVYTVVEESGPDHHKTFAVTVDIAQTVHGSGEGETKKMAEQRAAKRALDHLTSTDERGMVE